MGAGPGEVDWAAGEGVDSAALSIAAIAAHGMGLPVGQIPWVGVPNPPVHLGKPYNRATQLLHALRNTSFSITEFSSAGSALSHFMIVNGPGRQETLTTFDLIRAQSLDIVDGDPQAARAGNGALVAGTVDHTLNARWETMRDLFYSISNPDHFFYPYLLSKDIWKDPQTRYGKKEGFEALEDTLYIRSWNPAAGGWNKQNIIDYYDEIIAGFRHYTEATSLPWAGPPPAHKREWEFLLTTLNAQLKIKQWIPVYMAAREKFTGVHLTLAHIRAKMVILLTHLNYLIARTTVLPSLNVNFASPEPNALYGLIRPWIQAIRGLPANPTQVEIQGVLDDIRNTIRVFVNLETIYEDPKKPATPHPDFVAHPLTCDNSQARFILMHIDRNRGGGVMPAGRMTKSYEQDVEHVLSNTPPDPFAHVVGFTFTQPQWTEYNQRLGNRLLLARLYNNHYSNDSTWNFKKNGHLVDCVPPQYYHCNLLKHYAHASARADPNVDEFMNQFAASADWNMGHIQTWENWIIKQFILAVPPI